jgi:hypothetical protein
VHHYSIQTLREDPCSTVLAQYACAASRIQQQPAVCKLAAAIALQHHQPDLPAPCALPHVPPATPKPSNCCNSSCHNLLLLVTAVGRLAGLKQLGCCYKRFPEANHNRFQHSRGELHWFRVTSAVHQGCTTAAAAAARQQCIRLAQTAAAAAVRQGCSNSSSCASGLQQQQQQQLCVRVAATAATSAVHQGCTNSNSSCASGLQQQQQQKLSISPGLGTGQKRDLLSRLRP